jgi:two-component system response regulator AdeR
MAPLILIAEDQLEIADILSAYIQRSGMRTAHALDGRGALELHLSLKPALVVLDVQMPVMDGWQALAQIRTRGETPVIMLTAMDQDVDKLTGLRMGADDYVVKPFNPAEVVARIEAVLRRASRQERAAQRSEPRIAGPFEIDMESHLASVDVDGHRVLLELTPTEFKLLLQMMTAPSRVFSREHLLHECLPEGESLERTVDSHVSKLRRKLENLGLRGVPVSVRGVGYKLGVEQ